MDENPTLPYQGGSREKVSSDHYCSRRSRFCGIWLAWDSMATPD